MVSRTGVPLNVGQSFGVWVKVQALVAQLPYKPTQPSCPGRSAHPSLVFSGTRSAPQKICVTNGSLKPKPHATGFKVNVSHAAVSPQLPRKVKQLVDGSKVQPSVELSG